MSKPKEDEERLLTPKQVGKRLSLATSTIYKFAREGRIPCIRIPGCLVRFRWSHIIEWLGKNHHKGRKNKLPSIIY